MTKEQLLDMLKPIEIKPTYCLKIMSLCLAAFKNIYKTDDVHYTYDGIKCIIVDEENNQKYEIVIKPIK